MEAVLDSSRQSALHSLMNRDHYYTSPKLADREPRYVGGSSMPPSLSVISPTTQYPSHPPPPYTHNPPPSTHPLSGLISPPHSHPSDSRRHSDDKDSAHGAHRMSLPSIHEALADPKPSGYAPAPPTVITTTHTYLYSSQPQTPTTRPLGSEPIYQAAIDRGPRRPSPPQPIHSFSRAEQGISPPAPYEALRHPSLPSIRTALPASSPSGPRPEFPRHEQENRGMGMNGYSRPPPSNGQYNGYPTASNPASASPFSPHSPFSQQRPFPPRHDSGYTKEYHKPQFTHKGEDGYPLGELGKYTGVVKRNLDYWDVECSLRAVVDFSNELSKISSRLLADAQSNMHNGSSRDKNPSLEDCAAMEHHQEQLVNALRLIREGVHQNLNEQNPHTSVGQMPTEYEQDEMGQWTEEGKIIYGGADAKKRRGRAAPPGRCHSCNRAETPEWRRGPDGARTLCNACGLHYAKLTRKLGSQNAKNSPSGLRKSMDDGSTRS